MDMNEWKLQQRLSESLAKFQEYEAIIGSILQNLREWEPHISEQLDASVVSIEDGKQQLDDIKVQLFVFNTLNRINQHYIDHFKIWICYSLF